MLLDFLELVGDALTSLYWWRLTLCVAAGLILATIVTQTADGLEPLAALILILGIGTGIAWEWRNRHAW
jgi:hypothetical protein